MRLKQPTEVLPISTILRITVDVTFRASRTFRDAHDDFEIEYGTGSCSGYLAYDVLQVETLQPVRYITFLDLLGG